LKHPQFEFVDSAFGNIASRNHVIKTSEVGAHIKRTNATEAYTTYFRYTRSLLDHVYRNKTVKGYVGASYSEMFPMDLDSPDLNISLDRARKVVEFILSKNVPDEDVKVYFSGAKGFHICLASSLFDLEPTNALAEVYKAMAKALSKDMGIDLDPTIYDGMRLFRLENTLNSKSRLYKIPLTIEELFTRSVEEIKELAKQPRAMSYPVRNGVVNDYFMSLFLSALDATEKKQTVKLSNNKEVTLSNRNAKPCIARLLAGVGEGERDNAAMRLAVHYKKEGMPENICLSLLQGWNDNNDPPLPESDLERVVHSAYTSSYDFGCHDAMLSANCGPECSLHQRKAERGVKSKDLIPLGSLVESYIESLRTTGRVYLGIPEVDKATRGLVPGEVVMLMSRPGVGKCISKDSLIYLPSGQHKRIEDIVRDRDPEVLAFLEETGKLSPVKVLDWIDSGVKPVHEVRLQSGKCVKVTDVHPFLTEDGWKQLKDIRVGEYVATPTKYPYDFPDAPVSDEAIDLMALMITEGCAGGSGTKFSSGDVEIVTRAKRIAEHFGVWLAKQVGKYDYAFCKANGKHNPVRENPVRAYLRSLGLVGLKSETQFIPDIVFSFSNRQLARFIGGLFDGDGSVTKAGLEYCSTSKRLTYGVQTLLLRFGTQSTVRFKANKKQGAYMLDVRGVNLDRFAAQIPLMERKQVLLDALKGKERNPNMFTFGIPESLIPRIQAQARGRWKEITLAMGFKVYGKYGGGGRLTVNKLLAKRYSRGRLRLLGEVLGIPELVSRADADVDYDRIVEIRALGEEQVYDLSLAQGFNFVADNILVHNTAIMLHTLLKKPKEIPAIFFSLEMPATQIFERAASMVTGLPAQELEELLKDPDQRVDVAKAVAEKFQNVLIIDKDALNLKDIESYIDAAEKEVLHQKVRLVLIDHLGRMKERGRSEYEVVSALARQMKELAKARDVVCYVAVQVGRDGGGDGTQELSLSSARGSGQIEEGADVLLGMWRPDFDDESRDWDEATVAALKNRKGPRIQTKLRFHRSTLTFEPVPKSARNSKAKVDI
jgi:replicative DNA helicase